MTPEIKEALALLAVVIAALWLLGWVLSGPTREEKQDERRRLEAKARLEAEKSRQRIEQGRRSREASGRTLREIKKSATDVRSVTLTKDGTTTENVPPASNIVPLRRINKR